MKIPSWPHTCTCFHKHTGWPFDLGTAGSLEARHPVYMHLAATGRSSALAWSLWLSVSYSLWRRLVHLATKITEALQLLQWFIVWIDLVCTSCRFVAGLRCRGRLGFDVIASGAWSSRTTMNQGKQLGRCPWWVGAYVCVWECMCWCNNTVWVHHNLSPGCSWAAQLTQRSIEWGRGTYASMIEKKSNVGSVHTTGTV